MIAKELISNLIPPLKTSDTGNKALRWMKEFNVRHFPIVNNKQFLGLIAEEDIMDLSEPKEALGNHALSLFKPFVDENVHIFEVIKLAAELKLSLIPVVEGEMNYVGVITMESLIHYFAQMNSLTNPGGIIVLEIQPNEYSISEIGQIVESNNAKVLCAYVSSPTGGRQMEVTIKVNTTEFKHIVATFERYEYKVKAYYHEADHLDVLQERFDALMNYLNI